MAESLQKKLDRVRRPRVQITYDVETGGAMQKTELPFVVGVMADLSGQPKEPLKQLKDRKVVAIDRDNFNDVLAKSTPRIAMKVQNKLTGDDTKLAVELNFKHIDDFEPTRVAEQVGPLRELLEMRRKLEQLMSKMEGNDKLEQLLGEVMGNTQKAMALAGAMGISTEAEAKPAKAAAPKPAAPAPAKAAPAPPPEPVAEEPASAMEEVAAEPAPEPAAVVETPEASSASAEAPAEAEMDPELAALLNQMDEPPKE